jgi:hypothetical protein
MNYESAAGRTGDIPPAWPSGATVALEATRPTLVMFAHPKCPCTRASLGELNRLLARCQTRPVVHVFFLKPEGQADDWGKGDLWRAAANIPGVRLHEDVAGAEADRFGAQTSGHVVLYDPQGRMRFQGGITTARGQAGDSAGVKHLLTLLAGDEVRLESRPPVFGCALREICEISAN